MEKSSVVPQREELLSSAEKNFLIMVIEKLLPRREYSGGPVTYTSALIMKINEYYKALGDDDSPAIVDHLKKMNILRSIKNLRVQFRENEAENELVLLPYLDSVVFKRITEEEEENSRLSRDEIYIVCHGIHHQLSTLPFSDLKREEVGLVLTFLKEKSQIKTLTDLYQAIRQAENGDDLSYSILDTRLEHSEDEVEIDFEDYEETDEQLFDRMYENAIHQSEMAYQRSQEETLYD